MINNPHCSHRIFSKTWVGENICAFCGVFVSVVVSEQKSRLRLRSIRIKNSCSVNAGRYLGHYYTEYFPDTKEEKHTKLVPTKYPNYFTTRIVST